MSSCNLKKSSNMGFVSELMRIFDKVTESNVLYCSVCLRTEEERRLVKPKAFTQFVECMNQYYGPDVRVCYICETQAANAMRFRKAVNFAYSIHCLFRDMQKKYRFQEEVRFHLNKIIQQNTKNFKFIDEREQELKLIRMRTQLLQTEVLAFNSLEKEASQEVVASARPILRSLLAKEPGAEPECVLPDLPEIPLSADPKNDNLIVILDEDEDDDGLNLISTDPMFEDANDHTKKQRDKHDDTATRNPGNSQNTIHKVWVPPSNKIKLFTSPKDSNTRTAMKTDPKLTGPQTTPTRVEQKAKPPTLVAVKNLLNVKLIGTNLSPMPEMATMTDVADLPKNQGFALHPIMKDPSGALSVPTLAARIVDGKVVFDTATPQNIVLTPQYNAIVINTMPNTPLTITETGTCNSLPQKKPVNINKVVSDTDNVNNISNIDKMLQHTIDELNRNARKRAVKEKGEEVVKKGKNKECSRKQRQNVTVKKPILKGDRIDWEDKIPMDVISFMDATDPDAGNLYGGPSPMGIISDVRSVLSDPTGPEEGRLDIIDLC